MTSIWRLAIAEMRTCRRMSRTWLVIVVAATFCITRWASLTRTYVWDTVDSPIAGVLGPRYLLVQLAQPIVLWLSFGIVFLAFDVRSRDVRNRMFEAVDSRPVSNFELLAGRLLGAILPLLAFAVLFLVAILIHGWLAPLLGWELGAVVEPVSVLSFLAWGIVPTLLLWGSLTMLLSVMLRSRAIVALTVLGIMLMYAMVHRGMPLYLKSGLSATFTGVSHLASDIAPQFLSSDVLINRSGLVILAISFLLIAACLYPRLINKDSRPLWIGGGVSVFLVGVLTLGGLGLSKIQDLQRVEHWATVHKEHQSHQTTDVESITGSVEIRPGRSIRLDLKLVMAPQPDENVDAWLFSLNPGYRIDQITVDDQVIDDDKYDFKDGILRIPTSSIVDSGGTVHLVAQGIPDPLFAYLDSAVDWKTLEATQAQRLAALGQQPYVFHPQFVALLSGVSWFPTAGVAYGRHVFETHKRDFFDLDLEVSVPDEWIVADPGTRQLVDGTGTRFRFKPSQPIPEFALIASRFVRRAFETHGIEFELLLSPKHTKNLAVLAPAVPALQDWVGKQVDSLQESGLSYPFGTLSFVEVPTYLRVYGGGWKMGSAYSPPGIHMIRESGFPIAQFEVAKAEAEAYAEENPEGEFGDDLDVMGSYLFNYVKYYFKNDLHGGSPMFNIGEQFLGYQTAPHGKGATALHAFVNELVGNMALDGAGLFSIYFIMSEGSSRWQTTSQPDQWFAQNYIDVIRGGQINRSRVWEPALRIALADLDFEVHPKVAGDVILLKSHAISWTVRELIPHDNISTFLANLISEHRGGTYSQDDFFKVAKDTGIDFDMLVGDWLNSTELPGFLVPDPGPIVELVPTSEEGEFEYQTSVVVRNDEPVPGAVGVEYELFDSREDLWADTVHFPGNTTIRIALRTVRPVRGFTVHPHLAFNRTYYHRWLDDKGDSTPEGLALPYTEELDWDPVADDTSVVVDDLSDGFSIVNGREYQPPTNKSSIFSYLFFREPDIFNPNLNHGLPSLREARDFKHRGEFALWFREHERTSFGKYYRTYASNPMGTKEAQPRFSATLPSVGRWVLEFHVPSTRGRTYPVPRDFPVSRPLGIHKFEIQVGDTAELTELDLSEVRTGWKQLGVFEISSPQVSVTLVEVTDGVAIADAIRWTPAE
ncbi:MAG: hypothetical protein F4227_03760 [Gammaproteobacteria bacterium]|nr:hypothetical protein [Gammaproteobacteria bacterium]MYF02099.1 hypothetical protein [Gammaproteobacteria bacterium]